MSDWWNKYADAPPTNAPAAPGGSVWDKYPEAPKRAAGAASVLANDNPDQSAKVLKWEKETKVPASVIEADVPGFERDLKAKTAREAVERNRYISDFIDRDPRNASIANGDYANLEAVTKSLSDVRYGVSDTLFPEPVKKLATAAGEAVGRVGAAVAEGFGKEPLGISAENLAKLPGEYAMVWNPLVAQPLDAALRGVRALVYGNAQVFGEYVRATTGNDAEAARATRDAITMLDMAMIAGGNPMSPPSLNRLAARARTLTSSPEEIQAFIAEAQTGTARGSAWRSEIDDFLRTKEGAEVKQTLQIEYAGNNAKVLDKAMETAQSSALRTRAPERFEELARAVTDDNVYLPAEKIIEIYEKAGKVPAAGDGLFGYIPDLANRLRMAQAAGTEIEVSVGAYIAHTDPAVHKEVRDVVRLRHDSMTVEEAKVAGDAGIEVWHGSPASFDAFDMSKIGTGEGAQSYGHGLYFAENRAVADEYAKNVPEAAIVKKLDSFEPDEALEFIQESKEFTPQQRELLEALYEDDLLGFDHVGQALRAALREPENFDISERLRKALNQTTVMYKAKISARPEDFLDWDKPLAEQPQNIKDALKKAGWDADSYTLPDGGLAPRLGGPKGIDVIKGDMKANPAEVSKRLREAGIVGVRYLDRGSRSKAEGTSNYVLFDDKLVTILQRNEEVFVRAAEAEVEATGLRPMFDSKAGFKKPEKGEPKVESEAVRLMFDKPPSSMTQPEFDRYAKLVENQHKELLDRAVEAARKEVSRRQTPEWKANAERTRVEVETDLRSDPAVAADRFMHTGVLPTGETLTPPKLNVEDVNRLAPGHGIKELTAKDGIDPDIVAASLGFDTGADLIMALDKMQYERVAGGLSRQAQFKQMVDRETALRMEERYGNLQEAIAEEALDIALSNNQVNILAAEMEILAKEAGIIPSMRRGEIEKAVRAEFEKKPADEARRYERFQQGVFREGRAAEKALLKGDFEEAFKAKQRQMIALVQAAEAKDFAKVVKQVEKSVVRMSNRENKSVEPAYLNQIRTLLNRIGVQQKYPHPVEEGLEQFVADTQGSLAVADWLYDTGKRIDEFNVEEMRDFEKSLKSLTHVGRTEKKVSSARTVAELDNVVADIIKELGRFKLVHQGINPGVVQRSRGWARQFLAQHLLVERVLDYTDQFNPHGPITEFLDRPLRDAYTKELEMTERASKALRELGKFTDRTIHDQIPNKLIKDPRDRTGYLNMTRSTLRNLMLNMGNEGNLTKLAAGYEVQPQQLWDLVDKYATKKDWQYVQGMWDIYKWVKEEADAMQLRVTGVPADTVASVPVKNKHGDWTGGYWPIQYIERPAAKINPADPLYQGLYRQATTPQGYTKRRTNFVGKIDLSDNFIASELKAQIHDIAFREPVNNGRRLLARQDLMLAFDQGWSAEVAGLLPGWLQDIANSQNFDDTLARGMVRGLSLFRRNVVTVLTGLNPGTILKHAGGAALMSAYQVGMIPLLKAGKDIGVKGTLKNATNLIKPDRSTIDADMDFIQAFQDLLSTGEKGTEVRKFIEMSSAVMRNRNNTIRDSIWGAEQMASNAGLGYWISAFSQGSQHFGRMPIAFFDGLSANATWYAAYKRAFLKGEDHASAVFTANKEVSRAHGSNFIGDSPAISRQPNTIAGEFMRSATVIYRWWNHQANNVFQLTWDLNAALHGNKNKEPGATPKALLGAVGVIVGMIIWEHSVHPPLDEHDRWKSPLAEWAAATGRFFGSQFIGVRELTNFALAGYEPSTGPFGFATKTVEQMIKDANRGQRKQLIYGLALFGLFTGIGSMPIARALSFQIDKATGKERPRTLKEEIQGYWTGQSRPRVFR